MSAVECAHQTELIVVVPIFCGISIASSSCCCVYNSIISGSSFFPETQWCFLSPCALPLPHSIPRYSVSVDGGIQRSNREYCYDFRGWTVLDWKVSVAEVWFYLFAFFLSIARYVGMFTRSATRKISALHLFSLACWSKLCIDAWMKA